MSDQELEVKFYVHDLGALKNRLENLGARIIQKRTHEINLRFDRADQELSRNKQVLRLRQDHRARMTYKGPGMVHEGVHRRHEIEFTVSDFESAQAFLEALGFQVSMMYEKYRTVYELDKVQVTLDEMPYGNFVELEGADSDSIRSVNERLGLDWEARILDSYTGLFEQLRHARGFTFRDLNFANFKGLNVPPSDMNIKSADI